MEALIGASIAFFGVLFIYWFVGGPYIELLKMLPSGRNSESMVGRLAASFSKVKNVRLRTRLITATVFFVVLFVIGSISIEQ